MGYVLRPGHTLPPLMFSPDEWSRHTAEPAPTAPAVGGGELVFPVAHATAVDALYADWSQRGCRVAQKPVDLDFGRTFVVLDPDGHRLRVFAPA